MSWLPPHKKKSSRVRSSTEVGNLLLQEAGRRIGLVVETELKVPTLELVEKTGYDPISLRRAGVLPQPLREGYKLVISNPESININAFEAHGVPVCLASGKKIVDVWRRYGVMRPGDIENAALFREYNKYTALLPKQKKKSSGELLLPL